MFTAYWSDVPSMGWNFGVPSKVARYVVVFRLTSAVWGMLLSMSASWACGVPGTEASTAPRGCASGIFAKAAGTLSCGTYSHGPSVRDGPRNHRPDSRR